MTLRSPYLLLAREADLSVGTDGMPSLDFVTGSIHFTRCSPVFASLTCDELFVGRRLGVHGRRTSTTPTTSEMRAIHTSLVQVYRDISALLKRTCVL